MAEPQVRDLLPEDAYDGGDPIGERVAVLERAVVSILDDPDPESAETRRRAVLRLVDKIGDELLVILDRISTVRRRLGGD